MKAKDKLLEILGDFAMDELSETASLEVLALKLKSQADKIAKLETANMDERAKIYEARELIMREYKELRRNPSMIFSGPFFFIDEKGTKYFIQIDSGKVAAFKEIKKGLQYTMQQISREKYESLP